MDTPTNSNIRHAFVYERAPHVTLKSIANNAVIDDYLGGNGRRVLEPLAQQLNKAVKKKDVGGVANPTQCRSNGRDRSEHRSKSTCTPNGGRRESPARSEIDESIAARADVEYLYDKPYTDNARVRVAGPFTVESLSPHRVLPASEEELIDLLDAAEGKRRRPCLADLAGQDFSTIVIDYLKTEGVKQQAKGRPHHLRKPDAWPGGKFIGARAPSSKARTAPSAAPRS